MGRCELPASALRPGRRSGARTAACRAGRLLASIAAFMSSAVTRPRRSGVFAALPVQPLPALIAPSANETAGTGARDVLGGGVVLRLPEVGLQAALDVTDGQVAVAGGVRARAERDADRDRAALAVRGIAYSGSPDLASAVATAQSLSAMFGRETLAITLGASVALPGSSGAVRASQPHGAPKATGDVPAATAAPGAVGVEVLGRAKGLAPGPEPGIGVPLDGPPPRRREVLRPCGRTVSCATACCSGRSCRPRAGGRSSGGRCAGRGRRSCVPSPERWRSAP